MKVKNTYIHLQLDTGAKCNVLASTDLKKIDKNLKAVLTFSQLKSFYGHYIRCAGTVLLPYVWKDAVLSYVKFYIIDQTVNPVLGAYTCSMLGLVHRMHSIERRNRAVLHGIPHDYQAYSVDLDATRHLLNQSGRKHSASDTPFMQDSNSLEGQGQGVAGQNGA